MELILEDPIRVEQVCVNLTVTDWKLTNCSVDFGRVPHSRIRAACICCKAVLLNKSGGSVTSAVNVCYVALKLVAWLCRVAQLLTRLLRILLPFLNHPYQNMRDRLGSVLTNIFLHDIQLPGGTESRSPRVEPFVNELLPQLACLLSNGNRDSPVSFTIRNMT